METFKLENGESQKESKSEKDEQQTTSVVGMLNDFAYATTAHGISRIASASDIRFKIAWFIIWSGVLAMFIYMIVCLVLLYQSKPVSTSISFHYHQRIAFPGVTVCNLNMLRDSSSKDLRSGSSSIFNQSSDGDSDFANYADINVPANTNTSSLSVDGMQSVKTNIITAINSLPIHERLRKGYQFDDFIKFCTIGGLLCHKGFLKNYWKTIWNWRYGACFTFNGFSISNGSNMDIYNVSSSGVSGGMILTLDIIKNDYVSEIADEEGVRVLIKDQDSSLLPLEHGFSVGPGVLAGIGLKKVVATREDVYQNGSCKGGSIFDLKYSTEYCLMRCRAKKQLDLCNCTDVNYMVIMNSRPCMENSEKLCILLVRRNLSAGILDCSANCPQQCETVTYRKTITNGKIYADNFVATVGSATLVGKNSTMANAEYVSNNIVQLQIYFMDTIVEEISTGSYYKIDNLISDIGGQLGLWIGVSAVTVVEFLALTWNLFHYLFNRSNKKQKNLQVKPSSED